MKFVQYGDEKKHLLTKLLNVHHVNVEQVILNFENYMKFEDPQLWL